MCGRCTRAGMEGGGRYGWREIRATFMTTVSAELYVECVDSIARGDWHRGGVISCGRRGGLWVPPVRSLLFF